MIRPLIAPTLAELDALTELWEGSVRATHDFLSEEDIVFYRHLVRTEALGAVALHVCYESGGHPVAFLGMEGDKIEMLFVAHDRLYRGLGRRMLEYAVALGARRVDVNEQNTSATRFYTRMGFRILSRDALDASDRPFPILHLALSGE